MDRQKIEEQLRDMLVVVDERLARDVEFTDATPIREGLSLDSLQLTELVFEIEERLDARITNEEAMRLQTVGDVIDLIQAKAAQVECGVME